MNRSKVERGRTVRNPELKKLKRSDLAGCENTRKSAGFFFVPAEELLTLSGLSNTNIMDLKEGVHFYARERFQAQIAEHCPCMNV